MANSKSKILTFKGAVMTWECDSNRHMNVMYYINKFEHAGRIFNLEMGLSDINGEKAVGIVVVEQQVRYFKEVFEDDVLFIESSIIDIGNKAFTLFHEMYNATTKKKVSTMKVVLLLFDKTNRKALPFPTDLRKSLLDRINPHADLDKQPAEIKSLKRLIKVAKELNVGTSVIVDFLRKNGFELEDKPTIKLSEEMYQAVLKEFDNSDKI